MARMAWVTADTHFGEYGALAMFGRPFPDAKAMDDALVDAINRCVGRRDRLLHLGDFCGPHPDGRPAQVSHAVRIRDRIRCRRITLVRGNHDPATRRFHALFDEVHDLLSWRHGDDRLRVNACHWPMRLWRGQFKGGVLMHGHAHGGLQPVARSVDVGVDAWSFRPIPMEPLLACLRRVHVHAPNAWPHVLRGLDPDALPDVALPAIASPT